MITTLIKEAATITAWTLLISLGLGMLLVLISLII